MSTTNPKPKQTHGSGRVTGSITLRKRTRGPDVWYLRYRLADGREVQRLLGPAWIAKRGRTPTGSFTKKDAEEALQKTLTKAREGTLEGSQPRSGKTFADACAEWLRYVEHEKQRRPSTVADYRNVVRGYLEPEFGKDTPIEQITTKRIDDYRSRLLRRAAVAPHDPEGARTAVRHHEAGQAQGLDHHE